MWISRGVSSRYMKIAIMMADLGVDVNALLSVRFEN